MRLINADKLQPDCITKDGKLAISQSQIANAPTVHPNDLASYKKVSNSENRNCRR